MFRCVDVGGVSAKTQRRLGIGRSIVGVVSSAIAHSPAGDDLGPSSVERGDGDDSQDVQGLHGGVLESRARLLVVVCKEGVRMRFGDGEERY